MMVVFPYVRMCPAVFILTDFWVCFSHELVLWIHWRLSRLTVIAYDFSLYCRFTWLKSNQLDSVLCQVLCARLWFHLPPVVAIINYTETNPTNPFFFSSQMLLYFDCYANDMSGSMWSDVLLCLSWPVVHHRILCLPKLL